MYDKSLDRILKEFRRIKINGYEDYYINQKGVILNCKRRTPTIMKPHIKGYGYYEIGLRNNKGERKWFCIHKLVAKTFIPNPRGNKKHVNHIDGNKLNNNVKNLEWCTPSENTRHAFDAGLIDTVLKSYELYKNDELVKVFIKKKNMVEYLVSETNLSYDHIRKCISGREDKNKSPILSRYSFKMIDTTEARLRTNENN